MQRTFEIDASAIRQYANEMRAGDRVLLTGTIYTSRDQAHMAIFRLLDAGEPTPFEIKDAVIYYAGPTPGRDGTPTGACGPTTSSRMDGFTPRLLDLGLAAMIGKGLRSEAVRDSIVSCGRCRRAYRQNHKVHGGDRLPGAWLRVRQAPAGGKNAAHRRHRLPRREYFPRGDRKIQDRAINPFPQIHLQLQRDCVERGDIR